MYKVLYSSPHQNPTITSCLNLLCQVKSLSASYGAITQHSITYPIPSYPVPQPNLNHHTHLNRHTLRSPPTSVSPSPPSPAPFVNRQTDITCLALPCLACPFLSPKKRRTRRRKEKKNSQKPVQSSQVQSSQGLNYTTSSDKTKRRGEKRSRHSERHSSRQQHPHAGRGRDGDGREPGSDVGTRRITLCFALLCFALPDRSIVRVTN